MWMQSRTRSLSLTLVAGLLLTASTTARADITANEYGEYFCYTLRAAGIKANNEGQPPYVGAVNLGDRWRKFFLKVEPMKRDFAEMAVCKKYLDFFTSNLKKDEAIYDVDPRNLMQLRSTQAIPCVATTLITAKFPGGDVNRFYALEYVMFARGLVPQAWFSMYGDGSFEMGHAFDAGPVVASGKCERITPFATPK